MAKNNRLKKPESTQIEVKQGNTDILTVQLLSSINKNLAILIEELRGRQE